MQLSAAGRAIGTVQDWYDAAPPKGKERHWKVGRSAYELATAWCASPGDPAPPPELVGAMASHPDLSQVDITSGIPEQRIYFDTFGGEPRNADLALIGHDAAGVVAITIEAKADERYGETVANALASAAERKIKNPRSNGLVRIEQLVRALLPPHQRGLARVRVLRDQLLTATAGTLTYARELGAERAVLIIHEFITDQTMDAKHEANQRDLDAFIHRFTAGTLTSLAEGRIVGPFSVPGTPLFDAPARLYLGKISRNLRGT